jgi:hypothetical protein
MVETITPVVYGNGHSTYRRAVVLFVASSTLSGATVGVALGALGGLAGAPWGAAGTWLVAATALLYVLREAGAARMPVPARRGQVPEWWRTFFSPSVAAVLYGGGLGAGFLTFLHHGTLVVVALASLAGGSPLWGAIAFGLFGATRGVTVLAGRRAESSEAAARVAERLGEGAGSARLRAWNCAAIALVFAAAVLGSR